MKDIYKKHLQEINRTNKKYPLMEYQLDRKPLERCSKECQKQVATVDTGKRIIRFSIDPSTIIVEKKK